MAMYSLRKISKIRQLVSALEAGAMGPAAAAELLDISYSTTQNYLEMLVEAGAVTHHQERRSHVRLHHDWTVVKRFLDSLEERYRTSIMIRKTVHKNPLSCRLKVSSYLLVVFMRTL
jgi:predicted transcriptional regulator